MSLLNSVMARSSSVCLRLCQNAVMSSKRGGPTHGGDTPHLMSHRQFKIYTKTGDKGSSVTLTGKRMPKSHPIFEALGNIDELSSHIGYAKELAAIAGHGYCQQLEQIQCVLQDSATAIARAPAIHNPLMPSGTSSAEEKVTVEGIDDKYIKELEVSIDEMTAKLPPLKNFILPGGGQISSSLHVCRSVCRRAERSVSHVSQGNEVHPSVVAYINRLSDFLFMTSRLACQSDGHEDTIYRTPKRS